MLGAENGVIMVIWGRGLWIRKKGGRGKGQGLRTHTAVAVALNAEAGEENEGGDGGFGKVVGGGEGEGVDGHGDWVSKVRNYLIGIVSLAVKLWVRCPNCFEKCVMNGSTIGGYSGWGCQRLT